METFFILVLYTSISDEASSMYGQRIYSIKPYVIITLWSFLPKGEARRIPNFDGITQTTTCDTLRDDDIDKGDEKWGKGGWPGTVRSWWAGRGTCGGESVKEITPHSLKFHIYFLTFPHNDDKRLLVGCRRHFHEALQKRHSVFHIFFTLASQRVAGGVGGCC